MHLVFIPYGIKNMVDFVMEDLNHKYLPLRLYKEGQPDQYVLTQVQIRVIPFGMYELVFPKEFMDEVFSALKIDDEIQYSSELKKKFLGITPIKLIRKMLRLKPIPEYKKVSYPNFPMPEYKMFVPIIPLGIREDSEITEPKGSKFEGWKHEGI
jgi:hypothetical protein